MKLARSTAVALMTTAAILLGGQKAFGQQTVVLTNGDKISAKLTSIDGSNWKLSYQGGDLSVPVGQIASFTSPDSIGIRLADGTIGTARPDGERFELRTADGSSRTVRLADIAAVGPASLAGLKAIHVGLFTPFDKFWSATGGAGYSDKSGNSRARGINLSLEFARKSPKDRLTFGFGMQREESQPPGGVFAQTVNKYYGTGRVDLFLIPHLFVFGETRQERDRFQDLKLRSTYNGGLGVQAISRPKTDLRFSSSAGYRRELAFAGLGSTAAVLGLTSEFKQLIGPTAFAWRFDWGPTIDDFADYRLRSDASLTATAYKGLGIRLGMLDEYNSRPQPGVKGNDVLITTTLTYSIGK